MNDQRSGPVPPADDGEDGPSPFSREGAAASGSAEQPADPTGQRPDAPQPGPPTAPPGGEEYPLYGQPSLTDQPGPPSRAPWAEQPPASYGSAPDPYGQASGYGFGPAAQPEVPAPYGAPGAYGSGYGTAYGYGPTDHPKATPALVTGIIGLVTSTFCGVGGLVGVAGVVLGSRAKRDIDGDPARWTGRGKAQAGLVTGIIGLVVLAIWMLFFFVSIILQG